MFCRKAEDTRGLQTKALTDKQDGGSQNCMGGGYELVALHWPSTRGRCVNVGTCQHPIGALKSDVLM
jgi:hypothetical protein